ncbi:MAG TPA: serine/threonine-protein kinase [Pirellulales bacterium]|jgi:serine/threonine protein kinase|nr:serine/threonine-protein kinase [Pirellulales bacterium]
MSVLSVDKFIALAERSKLVERQQLADTVTSWKRRATLRELDNAEYCADYLVDAGLITFWQSRKLLEGRHRGFFLGKYKLLDHLGSGGMSSVYLAEHVLMRRQVAIKVLPQNRVGDSAYLARFHFEAQAAAALDHPNIVRAYDLDNDGKIHYLVMEYIEGRDLEAIVSAEGTLDCALAAEIIWQATAGLEHAHECGLVHRDIKPANLLIDVKGVVKILDMGLAKFTSEARASGERIADDQILGTADYLAPEQAVNSRTVDARADLYSLGCTLYFLLTGQPPFAVGTAQERMAAHRRELAPSILVRRPDAPPELVAICARMMEKDPESRFQSAREVRAALGAWLESASLVAGTHAAASLAIASRGGGTRERSIGKSRANLVSGSASDLRHDMPEPPPLETLQDTDCNLQQATIKMGGEVSQRRSDELPRTIPSESEAESSARANTVQPPPIIYPPRQSSADTREAAFEEVETQLDEHSAAQAAAISQSGEQLSFTPHRRFRRRVLRAEQTWWLVLGGAIVFLLGMILAAVLH